MDFSNPFPGLKTPLTDDDLVRALRIDLAAELDASNLYESHAENTTHPIVKGVLLSISDEEKVHAGEILRLIDLLTDDQENKFHEEGKMEVERKFPDLVYSPLRNLRG
jgi:rubrerythrin